MTKALASKKAIPSRPWFSNTMRRLPAGRAITKVLKVPESWADGEKLWMDGLFDANMLFPDRASSRRARCAVTYNERLELTGWNNENIMVLGSEEAIREAM